MRYRKRQRRMTQILSKRDRSKNKRDVVTAPKERKYTTLDKEKTKALTTVRYKYLKLISYYILNGKRLVRRYKRNRLILSRKSNNVNKGKKQLALMQNSLENVIFCSWLDQLNWILHKKYLRERRHLVQSFYCQPVYYGDATLYVR